MKPVAFLCTILVLSSTLAQTALATEAVELRVSRKGDINFDCGKLSREALLMREIITTTEDIKDSSTMRGHGINAATGIGSFLIGTATGGIGLAAAGFLLSQTNEEDADDADNVQDIAAQRRSFMVGIYNAKGCYGPIEHVMLDGLKRPSSTIINIASVEPAAGDEDTEEKEDESAKEKPLYNQ